MKSLLKILILTVLFLPAASSCFAEEKGGWGGHAQLPEHQPSDNRYYAQVRDGKSQRVVETARIMYLIEEVRQSPYDFQRNGEAHTGNEAANHLQMKYGFARGKVKTAEQFVEHVASKSSLSGEAYYLENQEGERLAVREVLNHELEHLDGALTAEAAAEPTA